jgi:hypothetical protein
MAKAVITPEAVLSYPALFESRLTPSGQEKYGASLIFDEGTDLSELKAAVRAAAAARWGDKAAQMLKNRQLRTPFREGAEKEGRGYGAGKVFINASSNRAPGVVSRFAGPDGKPLPVQDPDEVYPGCRVRASLTAFAYDTGGNRGVSFALNNVQKLGEGERLDGRLPAEDEFSAFEAAPADFDGDGDGYDAHDDEALSPTERLRRQSARVQRAQRRRLHHDGDAPPWGDDAAA